jgi:hypothetical protein
MRPKPAILAAAMHFPIPAGATDLAAALAPLGGAGALVPARVQDLVERAKPLLGETDMLLAPGFLTSFLQPLKRVGLSDYMDAQRDALRPYAADVRALPLNTQASVAANAAIVGAAIRESNRPVCILSHSKGGLDTLHALLDLPPELRQKVACWIAFQAPFAGSPIADHVTARRLLHAASVTALGWAGGTTETLRDLTVAERTRYMHANATKLAEVLRDVPVIAVAGALDGQATMRTHRTHFLPTLLLMNADGIRNDGMVPTWSSLLPDGRYLLVDGIDHTGTVAGGGAALPREQRELLTLALVALALRPQEN